MRPIARSSSGACSASRRSPRPTCSATPSAGWSTTALRVHLILTEGHTAPALGHAAVVAADHAEAKQRLRDAGFQVEDTRQLWGADRAFAIAPGGHRVELMQAPPRPSR